MKKKIYYTAIILVVLISLIPLVLICRYNCPSADDYSYAIRTFHIWNNTQSLGEVLKAAFQTTIEFWNTWQGLYVSAFLLSLQPAIFGSEWYALTGIIMMILIIGSTILFSTYILKRILKRSILEGVTLGMVMSFLMIQYMPSCVEGLYWYNGAMNYGFFFAVLLIYICLLIEMQREHSVSKEIIIFIACMFGAFLLEGGNHVTALMGVVFTAGVLGICCLRKNKKKTIENALIFLAIIGFLYLNISSPGTAVRQAAINENVERMGFIETIFWATWESIKNVGEWFGFKELVLLILVLPILLDMTDSIRKKFQFKFQYPLVVLIISVAWLAIMYCPPFYAMSYEGDGRLVDVVYDCFIVLLFFNAVYIVGWLRNIIPEEELAKLQISNWKYLLTIAVLAVALFISSASDTWAFEAFKEIYTGQARQYAQEYHEREELLLDSEGEKVTVSAYSVEPEIIFFDDIEKEQDDWKNAAMADYYGLKSIALEK